jgi:hypothetical protein
MTTRVKIDYGVLSFMTEGVSGSQVVLYNSSGSEPIYSQPIGTLIFNSQSYGKQIALENGALVEKYDGSGAYGSAMTLQPRIFYSNSTKTLMITVINLREMPESPIGDYMSVTGSIRNIQTKYLGNSLQEFNVSTSANISIRTNYTGAWNDYLLNVGQQDIHPTLDLMGDTGNWTNFTFPGPALGGVRKIVVLTYNIGIQI